MKISFVIPAYNEEAYLPACLRAVLREKQSADCQVEIIVVNNASTDRTKEVALSFEGVQVVDEPRKGLTLARQAGLLAASGNLIAHIDADCVLPPGWLQKVVKKFRANSKLVALSGPAVFYDLKLLPNFLVRIYYHFAYLVYMFSRFVLRGGCLLQGGNFVAQRSVLLQIGGYNSSFSFYGEDTELARRLRKAGPMVFTFRLPVYTSARRLKQEGLLTMGLKYPINYFWTLLFKRPYSQSYTDVRPKQTSAADSAQMSKLYRRLLLGETALVVLLTILLVSHHALLTDGFVQTAHAMEKKQHHSHLGHRLDYAMDHTASRIEKIDWDRDGD